MTYSLHPGAERDVSDALDFYTAQAGIQVAKRFLAEFERVAELLTRYPDMGTPAANGRRAFPLQVFPYAVMYRRIENGIRILVVRHQRRKPNYGGGRR